jgi:hypothetical protein
MTTKETIEQVLEEVSEDRLREVLDFAQFLAWQEERQSWQEAGRAQLARCFGDDEAEFSESDIRNPQPLAPNP